MYDLDILLCGGVIPQRQTGKGIKDVILNVFTERTEYPEERHSKLYNPTTKMWEVGNYNGPFSQLSLREKSGDTKPVNDLDRCAKTHDYDYKKAGEKYDKTKDKDLFKSDIWGADRKYINCAKRSVDNPKIGMLSAGAIKTKMLAEQSGILPTSVFSGRGIIKKNSKPEYIQYAEKYLKTHK